VTLCRTLAITGATGFVGQAVMDEAAKQGIARGITLRALTRRDQPGVEGVTWIRGDLADEAGLARLVEGADAVLHIAGVVNAPSMAKFVAGNVVGTQKVVAAARGAGVPRFVHVSSMAAREPGLSEYCRTKRLGEEIVQTSGLNWAAVRPPAVYGPRDTEMFELFKLARLGLIPVPKGGRTSLIHVGDLARLLLTLVTADTPSGVIYEVDDGRAIDGQSRGWAHTELALAIGDAVGKKPRVVEISPRLVHLGARIDRLVRRGGAKLTPDRALYMCHPDWVCDPQAAPPPELWVPQVPTPAGLAATAQWYRDSGWL